MFCEFFNKDDGLHKKEEEMKSVKLKESKVFFDESWIKELDLRIKYNMIAIIK